MSIYEKVLKLWQSYTIKSPADLDRYLDSFRKLFAYNSGKIENAEITYSVKPLGIKKKRHRINCISSLCFGSENRFLTAF